MRYVVSDVHGNYNLLVKLLNKIKFSRQDTLYILGDVIDKGKDVQKLLDLIFNKIRNNVVILAGNHEYEFIKFVTNLIKNDASDEVIVSESKRFLEVDDITLDEIDEIIHLPYYYMFLQELHQGGGKLHRWLLQSLHRFFHVRPSFR